MKLLIILALVAVALARPDDAQYKSKYDNFNVDEIIENGRLLKTFAHCFIGDGKCTPEGNEIKGWVPEAIQTKCAKCSEKQKTLIAKCIKAIKEKLPEEYEALVKKNDAEGKYLEPLKEFIAKYAP